MPPRSPQVGGENPEFILRDFAGLNCLSAREDIDDNEFAWVENLIPVAPGALYPVAGPTAALATISLEAGPPNYVATFSTKGATVGGSAGADYCFAVWANSGNGWIVNLSTFTNQLIISGSLTSNQTTAVQYSNQGLLIVDPAGYWDYNLTTPNVLTPQNGSLAIATLNTAAGQSISIGIGLRQEFNPATGTGGVVQADYQVVRVTINTGGTGYAVGDSITLTDGNPTTAAQIIVASVSMGGVVTGITLATGGNYPGPTSTTYTPTGPSGNTTATTGAGTGATFLGQMEAFQVTIVSGGYGYPASTMGVDQWVGSGSGATITQYTVTSSGVIGGTSIAVYAGRVWIGFGRTLYFTDINSYSSFGGVGGSFFIPDSYLHAAITALYAANNYLYIFSDTSVDALSNVTVTNGVTFFSRINVTGSVGTSTRTSIFPYYRAIIFYHSSGFYLLAGATPEKISEKISGIIQNILPSTSAASGFSVPVIYGAQVQVQGELCAAMLFKFSDLFTGPPALAVVRTIMALFFRGRWWTYSLSSTGTSNQMQAMVSVPTSGVPTLYVWIGNQIFQQFAQTSSYPYWLVRTKLYDGGAPMRDKQAINAAIGVNVLSGGPSSNITLQVDTELGQTVASSNLTISSTPGYSLPITAANAGGTQYLGLTASSPAQSNVTQIRLLALRGKTERDKLQ